MKSKILSVLTLDVKKVNDLIEKAKTLEEKFEGLLNIKRVLNNSIAQMESPKIYPTYNYLKIDTITRKDYDEVSFYINSTIERIMSEKVLDDVFTESKNLDENEWDEEDIKKIEKALSEEKNELKKLRQYVENEIEIIERLITNEKNKNDNDNQIKNEAVINDLIWWKGSEGQLIFLFEQLVKNKLVDDTYNERKYVLLSQHFKNKKGEKFESKQMSQAAQNLAANKNRKPQKADLLENIVKTTNEKE